jgi:benzoate membrane transport protein
MKARAGMPDPRSLLRDASATAIAAGFLAVLVSIAGPLLIFLQSARAMGVTEAVFSGWIAAISVTAGLASIGLSMAFRAPVLVAWSAPGVVLLATVGPTLPFSDVVGAYIASALIILVVGVTGLFDRLLALVPPAVASGMMAGILFSFGMQALGGFETAPLMVGAMLMAFVVLSVITPRFALIWLLAITLGLTVLLSDGGGPPPRLFPELHVTWPTFSAEALLGLALPLTVTTLTGQFLAGLAILRAHDFHVPARPILVIASLASLVGALFGGITTALASITMALGASDESHPDPTRRYVAGVATGVFFVICAVFAGAIGWAMLRIPAELIALLAGLALLGAIAKGLGDMLASGPDMQAGMLTFITTASGFVILDIGSAFWGILVGVVAVHGARLAHHLKPARQTRNDRT